MSEQVKRLYYCCLSQIISPILISENCHIFVSIERVNHGAHGVNTTEADLNHLKSSKLIIFEVHCLNDLNVIMDPTEIEFLAENQTISIIPSFNRDVFHLIRGDTGPFRAGLPVRVPMWMAIQLKQQHKCKIQAPDWMDIEILQPLKELEKTLATFVKMPSEHYMVEAKLLLSYAVDDIPNADEIRIIIKDIWDIRMSKLRTSIDSLVKGSGSYAAVDNLTVFEINAIRPLLPHALDQLYRMRNSIKNMNITAQSMNTSSFGGSNTGSISRFAGSSFSRSK